MNNYEIIIFFKTALFIYLHVDLVEMTSQREKISTSYS